MHNDVPTLRRATRRDRGRCPVVVVGVNGRPKFRCKRGTCQSRVAAMTTAETMQAALRASIAAGAYRVGPFLVTIDADATSAFRNYAIPDDGAAPSTVDIAELLAFFAAHDRLPRLEFVAPAPDVEQPLADAGFVVDNRLALLVLPDHTTTADVPVPGGVTLSEPTSNAQLRMLAAMQNAAYGEAGVSDADVVRLRSILDAGGAAVAGWQDGPWWQAVYWPHPVAGVPRSTASPPRPSIGGVGWARPSQPR